MWPIILLQSFFCSYHTPSTTLKTLLHCSSSFAPTGFAQIWFHCSFSSALEVSAPVGGPGLCFHMLRLSTRSKRHYVSVSCWIGLSGTWYPRSFEWLEIGQIFWTWVSDSDDQNEDSCVWEKTWSSIMQPPLTHPHFSSLTTTPCFATCSPTLLSLHYLKYPIVSCDLGNATSC